MNNFFLAAALGVAALALSATSIQAQNAQQIAPKKLLVVSTTAGFRHGSIGAAKTALQTMAERDGRWTLEFVDQPADGDLSKALEKLAPSALQPYDGVIFLSTSGELPLPDRDGFLRWIADSKAFIGIHAATDTFHRRPAYQAMIGAEFDHHGHQTDASIRVASPDHAATQGLGESWKMDKEELYQFKNYDATKVQELLVLDQSPEDGKPGHFPLAWTKPYEKGRVFYSALGHRDDLWNDSADLKDRVNSAEVSRQFLGHIQGGIAWALELN